MPTPRELLAQYTTQSQMSSFFTDKMKIYSILSYNTDANDGVTDATTAIQDAIDAANDDGGGIVFFPQGTYKITDQIDMAGVKNIALWGVGAYTTAGTKLDWAGGAEAMITFANSQYCGIEGIYLDGNLTATVGLFFDNASGSTACFFHTINKCRVEYCLTAGVQFGDYTTTVFDGNVSSIVMLDSYIFNNATNILCDSLNTDNIRLFGGGASCEATSNSAETSYHIDIRRGYIFGFGFFFGIMKNNSGSFGGYAVKLKDGGFSFSGGYAELLTNRAGLIRLETPSSLTTGNGLEKKFENCFENYTVRGIGSVDATYTGHLIYMDTKTHLTCKNVNFGVTVANIGDPLIVMDAAADYVSINNIYGHNDAVPWVEKTTNAGVGRITSVGDKYTTNYDTFTQMPVFVSGNGIMQLASGMANTTNKFGRLAVPHYTNGNRDISLINGTAANGFNQLNIGGGSSVENAITDMYFYTAANSNTATGTIRMSISSAGAFDFKKGVQSGRVLVSGVTGNRPADPVTGQEYFDTTIGKPIWYNGGWKDSAGTGV